MEGHGLLATLRTVYGAVDRGVKFVLIGFILNCRSVISSWSVGPEMSRRPARRADGAAQPYTLSTSQTLD